MYIAVGMVLALLAAALTWRCGAARTERLVNQPLDAALTALEPAAKTEQFRDAYYAPGWNIVAGPPATTFRGLSGPLLTARADEEELTEINHPPLLASPPDAYLGYFPKGGSPVFPPPIGWCVQWVKASPGKPFLIGNPSASIAAAVSGAASVSTLDPRTGRLYPARQIPPGYGARVVADDRGLVVVDAGACDHAAPTARGTPAAPTAKPYSIRLWLDRAVCGGGPVTLTAAVTAQGGKAIPGVTVRGAVRPETTIQIGTAPYPTDWPLVFPPTDDIGRTELTVDSSDLGVGYRLAWMVRAESNVDDLDRAPSAGEWCELG